MPMPAPFKACCSRLFFQVSRKSFRTISATPRIMLKSAASRERATVLVWKPLLSKQVEAPCRSVVPLKRLLHQRAASAPDGQFFEPMRKGSFGGAGPLRIRSTGASACNKGAERSVRVAKSAMRTDRAARSNVLRMSGQRLPVRRSHVSARSYPSLVCSDRLCRTNPPAQE